MSAEPQCIRRPLSTWSSCPCPRCHAERCRLKKRTRILGPVPRVSNDTAWDALDNMTAAGKRPAAIASITGIGLSTITHALRLRDTTGRRSTWTIRHAAALVTAPAKTPTAGLVPEIGSVRRLQALSAIGWSAENLARHSTLNASSIFRRRRADGTGRINAATCNQITALYRQLSATPGRSEHSRRLAAASGWPAPCDWEMADIDDPRSRPPQARQPSRRGRDAAIRDMATDGYDDEAIARELGCHLRTVERALRGEAA